MGRPKHQVVGPLGVGKGKRTLDGRFRGARAALLRQGYGGQAKLTARALRSSAKLSEAGARAASQDLSRREFLGRFSLWAATAGVLLGLPVRVLAEAKVDKRANLYGKTFNKVVIGQTPGFDIKVTGAFGDARTSTKTAQSVTFTKAQVRKPFDANGMVLWEPRVELMRNSKISATLRASQDNVAVRIDSESSLATLPLIIGRAPTVVTIDFSKFEVIIQRADGSKEILKNQEFFDGFDYPFNGRDSKLYPIQSFTVEFGERHGFGYVPDGAQDNHLGSNNKFKDRYFVTVESITLENVKVVAPSGARLSRAESRGAAKWDTHEFKLEQIRYFLIEENSHWVLRYEFVESGLGRNGFAVTTSIRDRAYVSVTLEKDKEIDWHKLLGNIRREIGNYGLNFGNERRDFNNDWRYFKRNFSRKRNPEFQKAVGKVHRALDIVKRLIKERPSVADAQQMTGPLESILYDLANLPLMRRINSVYISDLSQRMDSWISHAGAEIKLREAKIKLREAQNYLWYETRVSPDQFFAGARAAELDPTVKQAADHVIGNWRFFANEIASSRQRGITLGTVSEWLGELNKNPDDQGVANIRKKTLTALNTTFSGIVADLARTIVQFTTGQSAGQRQGVIASVQGYLKENAQSGARIAEAYSEEFKTWEELSREEKRRVMVKAMNLKAIFILSGIVSAFIPIDLYFSGEMGLLGWVAWYAGSFAILSAIPAYNSYTRLINDYYQGSDWFTDAIRQLNIRRDTDNAREVTVGVRSATVRGARAAGAPSETARRLAGSLASGTDNSQLGARMAAESAPTTEQSAANAISEIRSAVRRIDEVLQNVPPTEPPSYFERSLREVREGLNKTLENKARTESLFYGLADYKESGGIPPEALFYIIGTLKGIQDNNLKIISDNASTQEFAEVHAAVQQAIEHVGAAIESLTGIYKTHPIKLGSRLSLLTSPDDLITFDLWQIHDATGQIGDIAVGDHRIFNLAYGQKSGELVVKEYKDYSERTFLEGFDTISDRAIISGTNGKITLSRSQIKSTELGKAITLQDQKLYLAQGRKEAHDRAALILEKAGIGNQHKEVALHVYLDGVISRRNPKGSIAWIVGSLFDTRENAAGGKKAFIVLHGSNKGHVYEEAMAYADRHHDGEEAKHFILTDETKLPRNIEQVAFLGTSDPILKPEASKALAGMKRYYLQSIDSEPAYFNFDAHLQAAIVEGLISLDTSSSEFGLFVSWYRTLHGPFENGKFNAKELADVLSGVVTVLETILRYAMPHKVTDQEIQVYEMMRRQYEQAA